MPRATRIGFRKGKKRIGIWRLVSFFFEKWKKRSTKNSYFSFFAEQLFFGKPAVRENKKQKVQSRKRKKAGCGFPFSLVVAVFRVVLAHGRASSSVPLARGRRRRVAAAADSALAAAARLVLLPLAVALEPGPVEELEVLAGGPVDAPLAVVDDDALQVVVGVGGGRGAGEFFFFSGLGGGRVLSERRETKRLPFRFFCLVRKRKGPPSSGRSSSGFCRRVSESG